MSISSIIEKTKKEKQERKTPSFSRLVLMNTLYSLGIDENTVHPNSTLGKIFQDSQRIQSSQETVLKTDPKGRDKFPMAPLADNVLNIAGSVKLFEQELSKLPREAFKEGDNDNKDYRNDVLDISKTRRQVERSNKRTSGGGLSVGLRSFGNLLFTNTLNEIGIGQESVNRRSFLGRQFRKSELIQARIRGSGSLQNGSGKTLGRNVPNITTFSGYVDRLSEVADNILGVVKDQVELNKKKVADARRIEAEINQENDLPDAVKVGPGLNDEEMGPVRDAIDRFIKALDEAIDVLTNFDPGGGEGGGFDVGGGWWRRKPRGGGRPTGKGRTTPRGIKPNQLLDKNGRPLQGAARQSRIDKLLREKGKNSPIKNLVRPFIAKSGITKIGGAILKRAGAAGIVLSAGLLVKKIADGDYVGAWLDGMEYNPVTMIPAMMANIARDTYVEKYGIEPEKDPLYSERYPELYKEVKEAVADEIDENPPKEEVKPQTNISTIKNQQAINPTKAGGSVGGAASIAPSNIPTGTPASAGAAMGGGGGEGFTPSGGSVMGGEISPSPEAKPQDIVDANPIPVAPITETNSDTLKKETVSDTGNTIGELSDDINSMVNSSDMNLPDTVRNIMNPQPMSGKSSYADTSSVPNPAFSDIVTFLDQVYM